MAELWSDGFGTYGDTNHFRASGLYVYNGDAPGSMLQIGTGGNVRTGDYYWDCSNMPYESWQGGKMVGGDNLVLGVGAAFLFPQLPATNYFCPFFFVGDTKNVYQVSIRLNTDGSLSACSGKDGAAFGTTLPGVITPGAYAYLECKVFCDPVNGVIILRKNNVVVLTLAGINTAPLGYERLNGWMMGNRGVAPFTGICSGIADLVIWNDEGATCNDFYGDVRCRTFIMATNGPDQDFTNTGGATAHASVSNIPYNDAQYIASAVVGDVSNFGKAALPVNTAYVQSVRLFATVDKTDSGTCEVTPQISSNGTVADGTVISPGTGIAVYTASFEVDPFTGNTFSKAGFDAMLPQVERIA